MQKFVFIDYESKWKNDVFRMFYHITNFLTVHLGYKLVDTSFYNHNNRVSLTTLIGDLPDNKKVLVIEHHDGKLLQDFVTDIDKHPEVDIYLFSDDIHKERVKKETSRYYEQFKKIFVTYYVPFSELYSRFWQVEENKQKVCWIPHCVSEEMVVPFNKNPLPKISLLGHTASKVYPNRAYLKRLKETPEFGDQIMEWQHPSKKYTAVDYNKPNNLVGQTYFTTLSNCLCNFTCSLVYGFTVCKYFEIPYSGSLLLCDATHDNLEQLGLIDQKTCIIYKSQSDINEKIKWILDPKNRDSVDRIRFAGYSLIRERHMVKARCTEMDNFITQNSFGE